MGCRRTEATKQHPMMTAERGGESAAIDEPTLAHQHPYTNTRQPVQIPDLGWAHGGNREAQSLRIVSRQCRRDTDGESAGFCNALQQTARLLGGSVCLVEYAFFRLQAVWDGGGRDSRWTGLRLNQRLCSRRSGARELKACTADLESD